MDRVLQGRGVMDLSNVNETLSAADKIRTRISRTFRKMAPLAKFDADLRALLTVLQGLAEKLPEPRSGEDNLAHWRQRALTATADLAAFIKDPKAFADTHVTYAADRHSEDNLTAHANNLALSTFTAVRGACTVAAGTMARRAGV